jgi:hypothetical protein
MGRGPIYCLSSADVGGARSTVRGFGFVFDFHAFAGFASESGVVEENFSVRLIGFDEAEALVVNEFCNGSSSHVVG